MTALTKLLELNSKLPLELRAEQFLLINDLHNEFKEEKSKLIDEYERIIRAMQDTKPFEVVAVAGTAEKLLTDVTDTNVGEINMGDTVELNPNMFLTSVEKGKFYAYNIKTFANYEVENSFTENGVKYVTIKGKKHLAKYFRKVSTPIVNPLNTIEGC